jgi:hypothetical protein
MRIGCDVPAPAVGRAWLLLRPSRGSARGTCQVYWALAKGLERKFKWLGRATWVVFAIRKTSLQQFFFGRV